MDDEVGGEDDEDEEDDEELLSLFVVDSEAGLASPPSFFALFDSPSLAVVDEAEFERPPA